MSTPEIFFLIGRVIFGGYFAWSGLNHFLKGNMMAGYAGSKGVPMPKFAVYFSGLLILLGGLGVIFGINLDWAAALIAVFLVPVTLMMHAFWSISDPNARAMEMVQFLKNTALLGAAIMLIAVSMS